MSCSGTLENLQWFGKLCADKYEVTKQMIKNIGDELKYLGRTIRRTHGGYEWEGDDKHLRILQEEWGMLRCNTVNTPAEAARDATVGHSHPRDSLPLMEASAATKYRRAAARFNYVAQDRPDIAVAANQLARSMAAPREGDEKGIKRLIRYLVGSPRCVYVYQY